MAKKNWWLNLLKTLFTCESQTKVEKGKTKGWRWIFDKFRFKQLPASTSQQKLLSEAREEQRKHALNVAKATAAAANAAMAAAQAAVEVVRLTGVCLEQQENKVQNLAAIKIQSTYRAYLARKALRALKGVVRIQAIARGRAVRHRVNTELKHLRSIHQSQVLHACKVRSIKNSSSHGICERNQSFRTNNDTGERSKLECKSQRQWTGSLFSKEETECMYLRNQEAATRRERMKQYSYSHRERQCSRMLEETIPLRNNERHTCLRKQWADEDNIYNKGILDHGVLDFRSSSRISDFGGNLRIRPKNFAKQDFTEEVSSPFSHPRRSFCHMRLKSSGDDSQLSSSFPTYMAATESAKAKIRSMSTPRQRVGYLDACFERDSPWNSDVLYPWSSFNRESTASSALWKANYSQSKSLSMEVQHQ